MKLVTTAALIGLAAATASAAPVTHGATFDPQFGQILQRAQQVKELQISDSDEQKVGEAISEKIRARYGVVQDAAVHKYVGLVGMALAQASSRSGLTWHFIVLDTDGVNAFAAPGGYVHITRGALGLIKNEAELADVLAHEITHVTEKHTMKALQKNKALQMGANETLTGNAAYFSAFVDKAFEAILDGFGRGEELESDSKGIVLANKLGYQPAGLGAFLTRLTDRNKGATQKQGLFASHPEMQERLDKLSKQIGDQKLDGTITLEARYAKAIKYEAKAITDIATVVGGAGLTGGGDAKASDKSADKKDAKAEDPPRRGFGLSNLVRPTDSGEKKSAQVTASGGGRGVNTERDAKGGSNTTPVQVTITAADIAAFKKDGNLK